MTPDTSLMIYSGGRFKDHGMTAIVSVADAGWVTLAESARKSGRELRLLHAEPYRPGRHELSRAAPAAQVGEGVEMPAGATIAGLWDRSEERYLAVSRPFDVPSGGRVEAPLKAPQAGADLVVQLQRTGGNTANEVLVMRLGLGGVEREPDALVTTTSVAYGFWYDLPTGKATLHAETADLQLKPRDIVLSRGRVHRVVEELVARPTLGRQ